MLDIRKVNLLGMNRNEVLDITKSELDNYKSNRQYGVVSNLPRLKNLEVLDKRLGAFSLGDSEVSEVRNEVKQLLNEDVYKRQAPKEQIQPFSSAESYLNAKMRSK